MLGNKIDNVLYNYPENGQVDFQVEDVVGHKSLTFVADHPLAPDLSGEYREATAYDTSIGWSGTQTLTITKTTSAASPYFSESQDTTSTPN